MSDRTVEFLEAELKVAERHFKLTALFGIVAAVMASGYLSYISNAVDEFVRPEVLAEIAAGAAAESIPGIAEHLQTGLTEAAPDLAGALTTSMLEGIPAMRVELERTFTEMTGDMAKASADDLVARFGTRLEAGAATGTPEDRVSAALNGLIADLDAQANAPTTRTSAGQGKVDHGDTEDIFVSMRESVEHLKAINTKLKALAEAKAVTPEEHSTRRLIGAWMTMVEPEDSAEGSGSGVSRPASGAKGEKAGAKAETPKSAAAPAK